MTGREKGARFYRFPPARLQMAFRVDAARDLLNLTTRLPLPSDGDVLLFGTPGLAVEALSFPTSRRLSFVGAGPEQYRNPSPNGARLATGSPLSIAFCGDALPQATADAVLVDPPWYMDFIRPMLAEAAAAVWARREVMCSSVSADRNAAERRGRSRRNYPLCGARLGLDLIRHQPLTISCSIHSSRLTRSRPRCPCVVRWRRGDLIVLRKARSTSQTSPPVRGRRRVSQFKASIGRMRLLDSNGFRCGPT